MALGARSTKIHPAQPPFPLHIQRGDGTAYAVPTSLGEGEGGKDRAALTFPPPPPAPNHLGSRDRAPSDPPAAHSLEDPRQDEADCRLH